MNQKLTALIVDDEESARKLLKKLLEETLFFNDIKMASSVNSAITELAQFEPDMIFLDIKMPGKDGLLFSQEIQSKKIKSKIVFVTAYDQYALQAIKNQAFDYLLKPVDRKELKQSVLRFIAIKKETQAGGNNAKSPDLFEKIERIRINTRTGTLFINPSSIFYCKAEGNYTAICTGDKQHLCSMNLGRIGEMLPQNGFIRLGRSLIVNYEHITLLDRKENQLTLARNGETVVLKIPRQHVKDLDNL